MIRRHIVPFRRGRAPPAWELSRVNAFASVPSFSPVAVALRATLLRVGVIRYDAEHAADDAVLVREATTGDQGAFSLLYARYARMIHGLLLARVPRVEVDDLVQDVFLTAWRRLDSLRDPAAFGGWVAMIARNRATDYHRQAVEAIELPDNIEAAGSVGASAEARAVLDTIRLLPDAYRETLVLRLVEGMTGPEIAARTGLTPASVRVNLHRGMKMLRERLET
jgi:RNA polymerase sigma-70 factor (ECF subfamily)